MNTLTKNIREARQALTRYFQFYNHERPHQALDYLTPAEVYFHKGPAGQRQHEEHQKRSITVKEDKDPRLTPADNRLREWAARIANDTAWGERLARWIGKVPGEWQLRWKVGTPTEIPWTPLKRPLAEATVALITTGGVHLCSAKPFVLKSDATFRAIPRTATSAELCITHEHYDRRDAARDLNLIFPLQRLLELEAQGILGRVADTHYGFGFTDNPHELLLPGHEIGTMLAEANVDLVLLVPA